MNEYRPYASVEEARQDMQEYGLGVATDRNLTQFGMITRIDKREVTIGNGLGGLRHYTWKDAFTKLYYLCGRPFGKLRIERLSIGDYIELESGRRGYVLSLSPKEGKPRWIVSDVEYGDKTWFELMCTELGEGWTIPTRKQVQDEGFGNTLRYLKRKIKGISDFIWTSTEDGEHSHLAWYMNTLNGSMYCQNKHNQHYTVRGFYRCGDDEKYTKILV